MYTIIRDAFYGLRAGGVVKAICMNHDCSCKALGNVDERPVGTTYTQISVVTPNMMAISFEVGGEEANIIDTINELGAKSVLFSAGKVEVTTEGKYSTVAMANAFAYKNYMIA